MTPEEQNQPATNQPPTNSGPAPQPIQEQPTSPQPSTDLSSPSSATQNPLSSPDTQAPAVSFNEQSAALNQSNPQPETSVPGVATPAPEQPAAPSQPQPTDTNTVTSPQPSQPPTPPASAAPVVMGGGLSATQPTVTAPQPTATPNPNQPPAGMPPTTVPPNQQTTNFDAYNQKIGGNPKKRLLIFGGIVLVLIGLLIIGGLFLSTLFGSLKIGELKTAGDDEFTYQVPADWIEENKGNAIGYRPAQASAVEDGEEKYEAQIAHATESLGGFVVSELPQETQDEFIDGFRSGIATLESNFNDALKVCDDNIDASEPEEIEIEGALIAYELSFSCDVETNGENQPASGVMRVAVANEYSRVDVFAYVALKSAVDRNSKKFNEIIDSAKYL